MTENENAERNEDAALTTIVVTAPGRCGIVGNPTDMYGGSVISCTTRERAICRLEVNAGQGITIENDGETSALTSREQLAILGDKLDIARAALIYFDVDPASHAFTLRLSTSIPMR